MHPYEQYILGWKMRFVASRTLPYGFLLSIVMLGPNPTTFNPNAATTIARNVMLGWGVAVMAWLVLSAIATRYIKTGAAQLTDSNWEMCLSCEHPLVGLPLEGNCPECGRVFHRDETRGAWKERVGNPMDRPVFWKPWKTNADSIAFFAIGGLYILRTL